MSDTTKNKWDRLFQRAGIESQRDLATRTGVSPATINRLYHSKGRPDAETVRLVAKELSNGNTDTIWAIVGTGHFDYGDFPIAGVLDDLRLLTPKQRAALAALVKAMADPEGKGGTGYGDKPAKKMSEGAVGFDHVLNTDAAVDIDDSTKSSPATPRRETEHGS